MLYRVALHCYKEDWIAGKSELYIKLSSIWNTGYDPAGKPNNEPFWGHYAFADTSPVGGPMQLQGLDRYMEIKIGEWKRKWVNDFETFVMNTTIAPLWGGWYIEPYRTLNLPAQWDNRRDEILYVFFEFDTWPAQEQPLTLQTRGAWHNGKYCVSKLNVGYRSEQDPYCTGSFNYFQGSDNYACGEIFTDDCSKFEFITVNPEF